MFHLDGQAWFDAGQRRQDVIQDLFRRHPELSIARADLQPAVLVAVIALNEVPGANQDDVAVVGQFHTSRPEGSLVAVPTPANPDKFKAAVRTA